MFVYGHCDDINVWIFTRHPLHIVHCVHCLLLYAIEYISSGRNYRIVHIAINIVDWTIFMGYVILLSLLNFLMRYFFGSAARQSTDATNETVSVERVLEYRFLEPEKQPQKPIDTPIDWPSQGRIAFNKVFFRHFAEAEPVLRNLTFVIRPKEKTGVVGRTGAGKSSLIGALYRLGCVDGEIQIDGIDTANILLNDLRKQIAIIPQDPVLFSGTLRKYGLFL